MGSFCAACKTAPKDYDQGKNRPMANQGNMQQQEISDNESDTESQQVERNDPGYLIDEWKKAVDEGNNERIKTLFRSHYKQLNFLQLKWENGDNSFHRACTLNNIKLVKFLLILKVNVNEINELNGNTGLHYATMNGNVKIVKILTHVDRIDLEIENYDKDTPIDISRSPNHGSLKVEKLIMDGLAKQGIHTSSLAVPHKGHSAAQSGLSMDIGTISNIGGVSISYAAPGNSTDADSMNSANGMAGASIHSLNSSDGESMTDGNEDNIDSSDIDLAEWVEKRKSKFPYGWQKSYLILWEQYLLWNKKEIDVTGKELSLQILMLKIIATAIAKLKKR